MGSVVTTLGQSQPAQGKGAVACSVLSLKTTTASVKTSDAGVSMLANVAIGDIGSAEFIAGQYSQQTKRM
jgi:hypothetical protein